MIPVIPSTCVSGAAASWTSSGPSSNAPTIACAFHSNPACVSSAAFALPVVPEVNSRRATSVWSGFSSSGFGAGLSAAVTVTTARAWSTRASISGCASRMFSGTSVAPAASAPKYAAT